MTARRIYDTSCRIKSFWQTGLPSPQNVQDVLIVIDKPLNSETKKADYFEHVLSLLSDSEDFL